MSGPASAPRYPHPILGLAVIAAAMLLGSACSDDDGTGVPAPALEIRTATGGTELDPDGYTVTVDGGAARPIGLTDTLFVDALTLGDHSVALAGLAANCAVTGDNPTTVTVGVTTTAVVSFAITCITPSPTTGTLQVSTATSGDDLDPDGYALSLDGGTGQPIGLSATITLSGVDAGAHTVAVAGLAANCTLAGANPRPVTVVAGATAEASFTIGCAAITGNLAIITATTGAQPDPDGYTVRVDGGAEQPIGTAASLTVSDLAPGSHTVALSGVAANCVLEGDNPRTVTILSGGTASVTFGVSCPGPGTITWVRQASLGTINCGCEIWTMKPDGTEQRVLVPAAAGNNYQFEWSPSSSRVAFVNDFVCGPDFNRDIYVIDADGSGKTRLTTTPPTGSDCDPGVVASEVNPSWSSDGTRIAFTQLGIPGIPEHVWVMRADGSGQTDLTPGVRAEIPRWSPAGDAIAFVRGSQLKLYRMNADGSGVTPLSSVGIAVPGDIVSAMVAPFVWSPDGRKLAFVSSTAPGSPHEVFIVNADGSGEARLATGEGAAWSPDGRRLAFIRDGQLYSMNADGSAQTPLATGIAAGSGPAWSPDGRRLAVVKVAPTTTAIWVINADGTHQIQLTDLEGLDARELVVTWRP